MTLLLIGALVVIFLNLIGCGFVFVLAGGFIIMVLKFLGKVLSEPPKKG